MWIYKIPSRSKMTTNTATLQDNVIHGAIKLWLPLASLPPCYANTYPKKIGNKHIKLTDEYVCILYI